MSLSGSISVPDTIRGKINILNEIRGYSAYEVAVLTGYGGTAEEWLESLHGDAGLSIDTIEITEV